MDDTTKPRHVIVVRVVTGVATLLAVLSVFAVWANRQVLNEDNWANTSARVLADPAVKAQVADYLVDQLYANVDVAAEISDALPPRLQPLAGPVAGGLREVATRATLTTLGRPRVEKAWEEANRLTARQFIDIAEGNSNANVTARGNAVVLNLRQVLIQLAQRLGLSGERIQRLPADAGAITILRSDQVQLLQDGTSALKSLALVLPILALGMMALAVYLARGRRRRTIMWVGIDLVAAGILVIVARNLLGGYVVDELAGDGPVREAAQNAYNIGTDLLRDVAGALIIGALPLLFAAWLAGPTRPAVAARFRLAPLMRDHEGAAYGVLAGILLLIVAWGPIPATHKPIPVLIMIALAMLGLRELRRQTLEEFPPVGHEPEPVEAAEAVKSDGPVVPAG
jgi:hypothetical protein